jgi:hypothetical protein
MWNKQRRKRESDSVTTIIWIIRGYGDGSSSWDARGLVTYGDGGNGWSDVVQ